MRDLRQGNAAVFSSGQYTAAFGTHGRNSYINDTHEQTAENSCLGGIAGDRAWLCYAQFPDDLHYDDAKGKAGQGIHGVVTLQEAGEERLRHIAAQWLYAGNWCGGGGNQCHDNEDAEEQQEEGIEDLADPSENLARIEGEQQCGNKEGNCKQQQIKLQISILWQDLFQADSKGNGSAAGDGEEWPDGEI